MSAWIGSGARAPSALKRGSTARQAIFPVASSKCWRLPGALIAKPRLLVLDEPSMGLAPLLVQEIFRTLRDLNKQCLTIFLVEQNVREALRVAHYAYVMENGEIVLFGPERGAN